MTEIKEPCPICYDDLDTVTQHKFGNCSHSICEGCATTMNAQSDYQKVYVRELDLHVMKCPVCRSPDKPTYAQLETALRNRVLGGLNGRTRVAQAQAQQYNLQQANARRLQYEADREHYRQAAIRQNAMSAARTAANLPLPVPVLTPTPAPRPTAQEAADNGFVMVEGWTPPQPAQRPVVRRVIPRRTPNSDAPAVVNTTAQQNGDRLRNANLQPSRDADGNWTRNLSEWTIFVGNPEEWMTVWNQGQEAALGRVIGSNPRRYYSNQYLIPARTQNQGVPARRICNNTQCQHNNPRTSRRCPRGCGQFICVHCNSCETAQCQSYNPLA